MADQRAQYNEEAVGANHPTKADVINRLALVEHNTDGTHKMGATPAAIGTALQQLRVNAGATELEYFTPTPAGLPMGHISGLTIAHAADTEHDITVAAGKARDATDAVDMALAAAITKRFDAEWAVGSTEGGFASGESLPVSGTIHIWLIKRSDTGVVDVMANNHATSALAPSLPADYDYKRRIFSLRTDASNNIINGDQWGTGLVRAWMYDSPTLDISDAATGTNAKTVALPVPQGIVTKVLVNAQSSTAANAHYLSATFNADMDTGVYNASANAPLASLGTTHTVISSQIHIFADTSATIRYRSDVNGTLRVSTIGWEDSL